MGVAGIKNKDRIIIHRPIMDIEQAFSELAFTKTAGYRHYVPDDSKRTEQRDKSISHFLNDSSVVEPEMMFGRHDWEDVRQAIAVYDELLADLMSRQDRTPEEEDLADRIINKTAELFRYEELMLVLGSVAVDEAREHRRLASELSLDIMGYINQDVFDSLVDEMLADASESSLPYVRDLQRLVNGRPEANETSFSGFELKQDTIETIKQDLFSLYPGLEELLTEGSEGEVNPEDAMLIFDQLVQIGQLEDGWQIKLDDGKSARTAGRERAVYIGRNRDPFTSHTDAVAVGFHEVIVHGGRSQGRALAGSLDFEEGLATRLQQIISGKQRTPGKQYYLSIGLQAGADLGGEHRSYRQVFEILWRREAMLMERAGQEVDLLKVRSNAQRQVHRTRRGGAIDTRDSSYFVGTQKAAAWLNEVARLPSNERQAKLRWVLSAGFDPTNPEHVAIMGKGV